jgi:hypothetical protein
MTLGKFFAEKVEAGKPEYFRVAAQLLIPPAQIGGYEAHQHKCNRQGRKKKCKPQAA